MKMYELKNEKYSAVINLSRGANCISLRNNIYQAKLLREPEDFSAPPTNPYLYGLPILFPVNRIVGGKFIFEGREYIFPVNEPSTGCHLHGVMHQQEFEVVSAGKDFVVCVYRAVEEAASPVFQDAGEPGTMEKPWQEVKQKLYPGFPHEFEIKISYYLKTDGLEQITEVKNLSDQNMPVMIGFHTTFQLPFLEGQTAEDLCVYTDVTDEIERNMAVYLPTGKVCPPDAVTEQLKKGEFAPFSQKISRHYKAGPGGKMYIRDKKRNLCLLYENSSNMQFRLLYNGNADSYICLEPQNCLIDCLNHPEFTPEYAGFEYAKPGESKTYRSKISLIS